LGAAWRSICQLPEFTDLIKLARDLNILDLGDAEFGSIHV